MDMAPVTDNYRAVGPKITILMGEIWESPQVPRPELVSLEELVRKCSVFVGGPIYKVAITVDPPTTTYFVRSTNS